MLKRKLDQSVTDMKVKKAVIMVNSKRVQVKGKIEKLNSFFEEHSFQLPEKEQPTPAKANENKV